MLSSCLNVHSSLRDDVSRLKPGQSCANSSARSWSSALWTAEAGGASVSSNLFFGVAGCPGSTPGFLPLQLNSVPPGEQRRDSQEEQAERAERSDDGPEGLQMFGGNQVRFQCGQGRAIAEGHQDQPGH